MAEVLEKVKSALGIVGTFQDATLNEYISEVKEFMIDAGVSKEVVDSAASAGVISRGVSDLWNYGSGNSSLSPYFMQRVVQLTYKKPDDGSGESDGGGDCTINNVIPITRQEIDVILKEECKTNAVKITL